MDFPSSVHGMSSTVITSYADEPTFLALPRDEARQDRRETDQGYARGSSRTKGFSDANFIPFPSSRSHSSFPQLLIPFHSSNQSAFLPGLFVFLSNLPVSLTDLLSDDPAGSFTRRQPTRQNYRRRFFANHRGAGLPTSDRVLRIVQRSRPGNHVSSWKGKNTIQATELMNSDRLPATVRPPGTTKPRRHLRSRKIFS